MAYNSILSSSLRGAVGEFARAGATVAAQNRRSAHTEALALAKMTPEERVAYIAIREGRIAPDGTILPAPPPAPQPRSAPREGFWGNPAVQLLSILTTLTALGALAIHLFS